MTGAKNQTARLIEDKQEIEKNLNDMRDWGVEQQKLALKYYNEKEKSEASLTAEKERAISTDKKYKRIKSFVGYLAGALFLILYLRFGVGLVTKIAFSAGAYGTLIELLGPVGAFCAGYAIAYFYF